MVSEVMGFFGWVWLAGRLGGWVGGWVGVISRPSTQLNSNTAGSGAAEP